MRRVLRGCALALLAHAFAAADAMPPLVPTYGDRPEVKAFIQELVARDRFDPEALTRLLGGIGPNAEVISLVAPPQVPVQRNWRVYRSRFVERVRIKAGVAFWREHAACLARAQKDYGVPAEVLVGILGVETLYGHRMGRFPVLEALATLAFDYPEAPNRIQRSTLFRNELEAYLLWCRDARQDATLLTGSYTGAIGIPQF
ncbi:MAG TPA: lytic murein transglycosylase, partial [Holophaga sp.]|nr:lytic murein transglycosylase [Holophaga sp.]